VISALGQKADISLACRRSPPPSCSPIGNRPHRGGSGAVARGLEIPKPEYLIHYDADRRHLKGIEADVRFGSMGDIRELI
jgi:hypothetical protein